MSFKLKLIASIAFMAGQLFAYAIASSPLSPINKAEASPLRAPTMLVSECAMPRTPEVIHLEQIMQRMNEHRPVVQVSTAPHLPKPLQRSSEIPKPRPRPAAHHQDPVAALIASLE